jgi:hypothetical protein
MRDDRERLLDILDAIERIEERTKGDKDVFQRDEMVNCDPTWEWPAEDIMHQCLTH